MTIFHPVSSLIPPGIGFSPADAAQPSGSCDGDLSKYWADLPAPHGDTVLSPTSCSLLLVPDDV